MRVNILIFTFLVLIFSSHLSIYSQTKPILTFTEENGLADDYVRDILKDEKGYLWIATENGLSEYYGDSFNDFYNTEGLPNNRVWALAEGDGVLYAACYLGGLAEIKDDKVTHVYHLKKEKYKNSFRSLYYSKNHKILLAGTDFGVFVLKDSVFIPVEFEKKEGQKHSVLSFSEYDSRLFFTVHGGNRGLYEMFIYPDSAVHYSARIVDKEGLIASAVIKDTLYFTNYYKLYACYLKEGNRVALISNTDGKSIVWDMTSVGDSVLVMGCLNEGKFKNTVLKYNVLNDKLYVNPDHIPAETAEAVYFDDENNILWYGTDDGVHCSFRSPFSEYSMGRKGNIVDVVMHKNSLMVLTKDMLYSFTDGEFKPVIGKQKILKAVTSAWKKDARRSKRDISKCVKDAMSDLNLSVLQNEAGELFLRTIRGGISVPDLRLYYPFYYAVLARDENNGLYVQTPYRPLTHYPSADNLHDYYEVNGKKGKVKSVFEIVRSDSVLYFASYFNGVYAIKNKKIYYLDHKTCPEFDDQLIDVAKDKDGKIWCVSSQGSLMNVALENEKLVMKKKVNVKNSGIYGESYKWLIFNDDYLYLATDKGLNVISYSNLKTDSVRINYFFNKYNGYTYNSAEDPVVASNGDVFVHSGNKLIKISPEFYTHKIKGIEFENVFVNNQRACIKDILDKKLPYSTDRISFTFNVVKYPTAKNVLCRYRLNNGEWVNDNHVFLPALREGKYIIELEARNLESDTKHKRTLSFTIVKPFWQSFWFLTYLLLLIIFILFWIFRIREIRLARFHKEKTKLLIHNSNLKLRSLQLQMNPHFIFNSLTSIQGFILMEEGDKALNFIDDLAVILRSSLENASLDYIPLEEEIEFLKTYAEIEQLRYGDKLTVEFINELEGQKVFIPPMLIQPLIENAIKHGIAGLKGKGRVNVRFFAENETFRISVMDNGIGREASKSNPQGIHSGKALSILKERLQLLNAKHKTDIHKIEFIDLEDAGKPLGTEVVMTLEFFVPADTES